MGMVPCDFSPFLWCFCSPAWAGLGCLRAMYSTSTEFSTEFSTEYCTSEYTLYIYTYVGSACTFYREGTVRYIHTYLGKKVGQFA